MLACLVEPWRQQLRHRQQQQQLQAASGSCSDGNGGGEQSRALLLCPAVPGCDERELTLGCEAALDDADGFRWGMIAFVRLSPLPLIFSPPPFTPSSSPPPFSPSPPPFSPSPPPFTPLLPSPPQAEPGLLQLAGCPPRTHPRGGGCAARGSGAPLGDRTAPRPRPLGGAIVGGG